MGDAALLPLAPLEILRRFSPDASSRLAPVESLGGLSAVEVLPLVPAGVPRGLSADDALTWGALGFLGGLLAVEVLPLDPLDASRGVLEDAGGLGFGLNGMNRTGQSASVQLNLQGGAWLYG